MNGADQFARTLQALVRLYELLLACCEKKRDALVAYDTAAVARCAEEEEAVISRIRQADDLRREQIALLLPGEKQPTVTRLTESLGEQPPGPALAGLREHLRKLGMEVARVNRLNTQLCGQALAHLNGFLHTLAAGSPEQGTYDRRGVARTFAARPLVNQSA
ncbi:MAG: flagellar protein FlgN [Planctomycetes bacterium]|nr:flagellar protein FlgN [Planctomycetota bacterium]